MPVKTTGMYLIYVGMTCLIFLKCLKCLATASQELLLELGTNRLKRAIFEMGTDFHFSAEKEGSEFIQTDFPSILFSTSTERK